MGKVTWLLAPTDSTLELHTVGGYGPPREPEVASARADVREVHASEAHARRHYPRIFDGSGAG
jgi:N-methylhydantoinase B/oxoprolinase/acetone carboxylase alpha subunit